MSNPPHEPCAPLCGWRKLRRRRRLLQESPDRTTSSVERDAVMFYQDLLPRKEGQAATQHRQPAVNHDGKQGGTSGDGALLFLGPYPVTSALLWVVHLLYFVQWRKSRRRRRNRSGSSPSRITYRTIVEKKHFYKWWAALLVQYHPSRTGDADVGSNLAVDMGHADEDTTTRSSATTSAAAAGDLQPFRRWIERQSQTVIGTIPESWRESTAAARLMHGASLALVGIQRGVALAGGKAVILLLYNTHLLWSCRALEMHYGSTNSSDSAYSHFSYLRLLVSVGLWETLLELLVSAYLLRALGPNNNPAPPPPATDTPPAETLLSVEHEPNGDSPLLRRIRKRIRGRTMGASLSMMCAALLMIFRIQFPYVSVPILPWIPISRWFHLSPFLSHLMALLLLHHTSVAATGDSATSWVALGCGGFVGMLWGTGWLDFCSDAYWGNGVLVLTFLLTALSLKARNPRMSLLLWIDWVGWNDRGNMLFYDTNVDRWVEVSEERLPTVGAPEESDSESEDSMSDEDDSDRAFPTADDNEIYGRLPALSSMEMGQLGEENAGSDGEGETSQLIPSSPTGSSRNTSQFRSRRTGPIHSDPESRER